VTPRTAENGCPRKAGALLLALVVGAREWMPGAASAPAPGADCPLDGALDPCGLSWTAHCKRGSTRRTFLF